ncbi:MAG: DinB family protein [Fimbriimonadaceae bacterium]|nr:DinB family protein [Fimbriimonadaceae bacterium]
MNANATSLRDTLIEGFRYDAWANARWDAVLAEWPNETAHRWRLHLANAKRTWLTRFDGQDHTERSETEVDAAWIAVVAELDLDEALEYRTLSGVPFTQPNHEIVRHVINHGTYHRGQLRMLAEIDGIAWPETDLIFFSREQSAR